MLKCCKLENTVIQDPVSNLVILVWGHDSC